MPSAQGTDARALVKAAQRLLIHQDVETILDAVDQAAMTKEAAVAAAPCPGSKLRSGGKGRGLGRGGGKGPIGVPVGAKIDPDVERLPEALQDKAYQVKAKVPKPGFPKATALAAVIAGLLEKGAARKGNVRNPGAIAAAIGQTKFGAGRMQAIAAKGRKAAKVKVRDLLIKQAGKAIVILKHGNTMEKQAAVGFLRAIIPQLARLGAGAARLGGRALSGLGTAAGKVGLGGAGKTLGRAAKTVGGITGRGAGTRAAGLGTLLAGGGLLGGGVLGGAALRGGEAGQAAQAAALPLRESVAS